MLILSGIPGTTVMCALSCPKAASESVPCHEQAPPAQGASVAGHHHCNHELDADWFVTESKPTSTLSSWLSATLPSSLSHGVVAANDVLSGSALRESPPGPLASLPLALRI